MSKIAGFPSCLWLNNNSLCVYTTFSLSIHFSMTICSQVLATVNVAMNMRMHVLLEIVILFPLTMYLEVELLVL